MTTGRQTAETLTTIRTLVQRETGDEDGDRWASAAIDSAANMMLVQMANEAQIRHAGNALLSDDLSYTGSDPNDLPADVDAEMIYRVDDVTNTATSEQLEFVTMKEAQDYDASRALGPGRHQRYTLLGASSAVTTVPQSRIWLVPRPSSSKTLRIWYAATPFVMGAAADLMPLSPRWTELVALGAAEKLLRRDEELTNAQRDALGFLWRQYRELCGRQRNAVRVRRRRLGSS